MKLSGPTRLVLTLSIALAGVCALAQPPNPGYHLLKKIPLKAAPGGSEYFDYITFDAVARRAYISHGTEVVVLDADKGTRIGAIEGLKRGHGVALVPALNRGFISDGDAGQIVIFDLKTLKTIGRIKGEDDADCIIYDPASGHVFVFNGDPKSATVIDPSKGTVIATLALGGSPEQAVADGKGMIYANLADKNEVVAIDSRNLKITSRWPVAPAGQPTSIAMNLAHRRLFIGGRNPRMLVVMDADNGKIVSHAFPIGDGVDGNVFDPQANLICAATREGTLHIIHEDAPDKYSVVEKVKTEFGAKTIALDPRTHNLYLTTADFHSVTVSTGHKQGPQRVAIRGTFHLLIYGH